MSFFALSLFAKAKQHFRHQTRLSTYGGSIHALAISNDGQALACSGNLTRTLLCEAANRRAGTEGVKLWDIKSRKELTCSTHHHESRGTISCTVWITTRQGMAATLCYGTGLGYIMQFQEACARRLGSGFEITCMVWDSTSSEANTQIAVGTRDKIVQVLVLNPNSQLQAVFLVRLDNTMPNGHAAVNQKRGVFIVDNATNGFTLYRLEGDEEPVRTFVTAAPSASVPKQVAFGAEGRLVIRGSDHGSVYAFERKSGKVFETLRHSNTGLVQTIATRDVDRRCIVASASPALGRGKATINLWSYDYGTVKGTLTSEQSWSTSYAGSFWGLGGNHLFFGNQLLSSFVVLIFNEVPEARHRVPESRYELPEARQEVVKQNQILMLHQLAGKLIQVVQEAMKDGDVGEDIDMTRHEEISTEAKRVFFNVMKEENDGIGMQHDSGKEVFHLRHRNCRNVVAL
ncbi:hypothetical protein EV702DRAFT_1047226 [Suillus placidus]|uniref:Uncharacterized protein n=1 Tax=Suillus placidus TaxID=48579 RepID=A0A9P6ZQU9_9AGAM|nr:hypothetical protein EV702DRAFT_1047226 [Suillus placidus]